MVSLRTFFGFPQNRILPGESVISDGSNVPRVRQADYDGILPGLGEVSAFTQAGGHPERNDDAFGISGEGVFMVADGVSQSPQGDLASAMAVKTVFKCVREGASLGNAFLEADAEIRRIILRGQTIASAMRVYPDGVVEIAVAGDVEIWALRRLKAGDYDVLPYAVSFENVPNVYLGGGPLPKLAGRFPAELDEIVTSKLSNPSPGFLSSKLAAGDGILLMVDGLARYYHRYPGQLRELINSHSTATAYGMRRALQEDGTRRLEAREWSRQFAGKKPWAVPRSFGGFLEGKFINSEGQIFASRDGEAPIGDLSAEDNQSALVFIRTVS